MIERAVELGLDVTQVASVRDQEFLGQLDALEPDVAVVVAFGQIFRRRLLELPRLGCINLHGSLLPSFRGAAPIQAAVAAGDRVTGVTSMVMARGLDSGPMLLRSRLEIGARETAVELSPRLADLGSKLMIETLDGLAAGELEAEPQDHAQATYAPRLERQDSWIDWRLSAEQIFDRWRAHVPWPGTQAMLDGQPVKLLTIRALEADALDAGASADLVPGTLLGPRDGAMVVVCGGGTIAAIDSLQRPGKKAVGAMDFWNGERLKAGIRFSAHLPSSV